MPGLRFLVYVLIASAIINVFREGPAKAGYGLAIQLALVLGAAVLIWAVDKGFRWGIKCVGERIANPVWAAAAGAVLGAICWGGSSVSYFWALDALMRCDNFV